LRFPLSGLSAALALSILVPVLPIHALSQVEGRIAKSVKSDGRYDLRIRVWDKSGTGEARLVQMIQIPKVDVVGGLFNISLDAGLEMHKGRTLSFEIEARPFETYIPFKTAEIHRVLIAAI
jgi:hypothetical protein